MTIKIAGTFFKDDEGRVLHLRGVNLGGSSKVPYTPNGATYLREHFYEHRTVSFIGRPFPLEQADEHLQRLKAWGLTFLRFIITWEAIEHAGPGIYDEAYLDYITEVIKKAGEHGFVIFIDPHQDVWSRFSGGDGAPGWTFEKVGLNIETFKETGAAIVHQTHGDPFPRMVWPTNNSKLAAATLFTLFFGGNDFAPATQIDGIPAQDYLQTHYLNAVKQVAMRVKDMPHVLGYDSLNEPSHGYIGAANLTEFVGRLKIGACPTPYQSMLLGMGHKQTVGEWTLTPLGARQTQEVTIDPRGTTAWLPGYECLWKQNGVWDIDSQGQPHLLRPHHFAKAHGRPINFGHDYLRPFINRYAAGIREVHPNAIMFVEADAISDSGIPQWGKDDAQNIVYAPHWYDALTLLTKQFRSGFTLDIRNMRPVVGKEAVQKAFNAQLKHRKDEAQQLMGDVPVVIGEVGIPYDLNNKRGLYTGDYRQQVAAMNASMTALEANLLNFTLWNYTADNTHERGDLWNDEDLSIFSEDDRRNPKNIHSGGRALQAVVRPYARATAGTPVRMSFNIETGVFEYIFRHDKTVLAPTEFFIPNYQYPQGYRVEVGDGEYEIQRETQTLLYRHTDIDVPHFIRVLPDPAREIKPKNNWRKMLVAASIGYVAWRILRRKR